MRKRLKKKIKISKIIMIIVFLIFFLTYSLLKTYYKYVKEPLIVSAKVKLEKFTNNFLSNSISYDILNDKNLENILVINKNKNGEILYVDYNLDKAYEALEIITDVIYEKINDLETGYYSDVQDEEISPTPRGLMLKMPLFVASNNPLLTSFGPDIYTRINFDGAVLTNIKSQITEYGYNNALVELFVTINISEQLLTPVIKDKIEVNYDVLVASKVINGRVPEFYDGVIENESANLDIPIT